MDSCIASYLGLLKNKDATTIYVQVFVWIHILIDLR